MTDALFMHDSYAKECQAEVLAINERGGIVLDKTVFYATSGGQTGDKGVLVSDMGTECPIALTVYDEQKQIVHVPAQPSTAPEPGVTVTAKLDWGTRYAHMRMHTCLHLLCSLIPYPVTGGSIAHDSGRLDFDLPEASLDKVELTDKLNALISQDHPVSESWISDAELEANPDLVRTMAVKPPMGSGKVRLISIGDSGKIDRQPCGGTHVKSTSEIGSVMVKKIEKKGKQNRRVRIVFV